MSQQKLNAHVNNNTHIWRTLHGVNIYIGPLFIKISDETAKKQAEFQKSEKKKKRWKKRDFNWRSINSGYNSVEAYTKDIAVLGIQIFKNNSSICRNETLITQLKNKNQKFMKKEEGRNRKKGNEISKWSTYGIPNQGDSRDGRIGKFKRERERNWRCERERERGKEFGATAKLENEKWRREAAKRFFVRCFAFKLSLNIFEIHCESTVLILIFFSLFLCFCYYRVRTRGVVVRWIGRNGAVRFPGNHSWFGSSGRTNLLI